MIERPNTVAGLVEKRRELAARIEQAQRELRALVIDLDHIEAAIRIFDPNAELGPAKRRWGKHAAFKGEMARYVLSALRQAKVPITSLDLAKRVMEQRGLPPDDRMTIVVRKRVGACLNTLKARSVVRPVPMEGEYKGWELAR